MHCRNQLLQYPRKNRIENRLIRIITHKRFVHHHHIATTVDIRKRKEKTSKTYILANVCACRNDGQYNCGSVSKCCSDVYINLRFEHMLFGSTFSVCVLHITYGNRPFS